MTFIARTKVPNVTQLKEYEAFVAIVEENSLSKAADRLNLSKSAVSKQLTKLEQRLGINLINRSTQGLVASTEGLNFYPQCKEVLLSIHTYEQRLKHTIEDEKGKLRISFSQVLLQSPIIKLLSRFSDHHPGIVFDIRVEDSFEDLLMGNIDFAFRVSHQEDSRLVARPLTDTALILCASPAYLKKHGKPRMLKSLLKHKLIVSDFDNYKTPKIIQDEWLKQIDLTDYHTCNNVSALVESSLQGMGIIAVLDIAVRDQLANGSLIRIFPEISILQRTLHLVYPSQRYPIKRQQLFKAFIEAEFLNS